MARGLVDTFSTNHANLTGRTPETGGTWASVVGGAMTSAGRARHSAISTDNALYRNTAALTDADYWVECPVYRASATAQMAGPAGRIDPGASQYDWYMAPFDDSTDEVQLISVAGGSPTELGSVAVTPPGVGSSQIVRLTMDGNQISADYNGSQVIAPVTNNVHTATGQAGCYWSYLAGSSDTTGLHLESVDAENDLSTGPEEHSGAASISGGGTITSAGTKTAGGTVAVPGGGSIAAEGTKAAAGLSSVAGGGTITAIGQKHANGSVAVSGGGTIIAVGASSEAEGSAAISGGGLIQASGTKAANGAVSISGGGSIVAQLLLAGVLRYRLWRSGTLVGEFSYEDRQVLKRKMVFLFDEEPPVQAGDLIDLGGAISWYVRAVSGHEGGWRAKTTPSVKAKPAVP